MRSDSTYGVFNGESPIQPDSGGSFAPLEMLRIFKCCAFRASPRFAFGERLGSAKSISFRSVSSRTYGAEADDIALFAHFARHLAALRWEKGRNASLKSLRDFLAVSRKERKMKKMPGLLPSQGDGNAERVPEHSHAMTQKPRSFSSFDLPVNPLPVASRISTVAKCDEW
jgi:hypothetical protein